MTVVYAFGEYPPAAGETHSFGPSELTRLGFPVPAGFVIDVRPDPAAIDPPNDLARYVAWIEAKTGRRLGEVSNPLVLCVRLEPFTGPRIVEVEGIGLNDDTVNGLARRAGSDAEHSVWTAYKRFITTFATAVLGVPGEAMVHAEPIDEDAPAPQQVTVLKRVLAARAGLQVPHDPYEQLNLVIRAAYGTATVPAPPIADAIPEPSARIIVQTMVFGQLNARSGTGIATSRNPDSGSPEPYGKFVPMAQPEDLATIGRPCPLAQIDSLDRAVLHEIGDILSSLERYARDIYDIEFTVEDGTLWVLRCRPSPRDPARAFIAAASLAQEGLIDHDEALRRVTGDDLTELLHPIATPTPAATLITFGIPASPGVASGQAVFAADRAITAAAAGHPVILVLPETHPADVPGIHAAQGVLTTRGGRTSHAAVVARGIGRPSVCGANALDVDLDSRSFTVDDVTVREGDHVTVDGSTGRVYVGQATTTPSDVTRYLDNSISSNASPLVAAVHSLLQHADARRRLRIRANVDTPRDAARARRVGAEGIGLCRIEHMLLGDRHDLVERIILAKSDTGRQPALLELRRLLRADISAILNEMNGLPVTIRLVDPPLHEFLPPARAKEHNPMLGVRGVRLAIMIPSLLDAQVCAIAEAVFTAATNGMHPRVEILIPFVSSVHELEETRARAIAAIKQLPFAAGAQPRLSIGAMIETPRAALTTSAIAQAADFLSFGTNDLTQMTWGLSRDDTEQSLIPTYMQLGILTKSPFQTLDGESLGRLMHIAITDAHRTKPDIRIGACGEHSGDAESIHLLHKLGLDYISCSPPSIPAARLEAARATIS